LTTTVRTDEIGLSALILVGAAWLVFALIFVLRARTPKVREVKRATVSRFGIASQAVAFIFVWAFHRPQWWPFSASTGAELVLAIVAIVFAWLGGWLCFWSVQTLGKQWTLRARVIEGHELITAGPYGIVRNPIYLGLFGLILATGLVLATWWALAAGIVFYLVGTLVRIRAEEALLRETFGAQFADYASRVPAFVPRLR
jgi:protein-S-isoprenylcysteine O-methyltransferase Ste14